MTLFGNRDLSMPGIVLSVEDKRIEKTVPPPVFKEATVSV